MSNKEKLEKLIVEVAKDLNVSYKEAKEWIIDVLKTQPSIKRRWKND